MIVTGCNPLNNIGVYETILILNKGREGKIFLTIQNELINVEKVTKLEKSSFDSCHSNNQFSL